MVEGTFAPFDLAACDTAFAVGLPVDMVINADGGSLVPEHELANCNEVRAEFTDNGPGVYNISVQYSVQTGGVCLATAVVTVTPL